MIKNEIITIITTLAICMIVASAFTVYRISSLETGETDENINKLSLYIAIAGQPEWYYKNIDKIMIYEESK